jgi:hypothetical protein
MADVSSTDGKTYYRAAFVRPLATLNEEKAVPTSELNALNAQLGGLLAPSNGAVPRPRGPVPGAPERLPDEGTGEIPF